MTIPNEKLQRARLEKHWSVAVASSRAGVSVNTFNRWERGLQIPQLGTLDQLCAAFELSAEDLGFGHVVRPPKKAEFSPLEEKEGVSCLAAVPLLLTSIGERPLILNSMARHGQGAHVETPGSTSMKADFSRRQVIAALIGAPAAVFGTGQRESLSVLRVEEELTLCAVHIPLCWQLYFEGGLVEVEQALPVYITQLSSLVRSSTYQKRAASLLSQAYQLASLVAIQHQDYGKAAGYAQQGQLYGEMAASPGLQVGSLIRQALVWFFLKRARPCLQAYQKALRLAEQASPLLQGRVYAGLAEAYSQQADKEREARHYFDLAMTTFPQNAEEDPAYVYTHFTPLSLSTYEGLMYINLNQLEQAEAAFARIDCVLAQGATPNRLELLVHQAMVTCAQGDLEQAARFIATIVPMAHKLDSQLRADQAYELYEQMLRVWPNERIVKSLEELFAGA